MTTLETFESKLITLSPDDIHKMSKYDNGSIGNVLRGINKHCYAINCETEELKKINFIFINDSLKKPGTLFELEFNENKFYEYLMMFSIYITNHYQLTDPVNVYNTYINYYRTLLEKKGIFTLTSFDLTELKKKNSELFSAQPIEILKTFEKEDFYKRILNAPDKLVTKPKTNYVYIMLNKETGYFKIGESKKPSYRERTLHSKEPAVVLLKVWEGDRNLEKKLHKKYTDKRIRGEWFKLNLIDLASINETINKVLLATKAHMQ